MSDKSTESIRIQNLINANFIEDHESQSTFVKN